MRASREGWLIHAAVGILGGVAVAESFGVGGVGGVQGPLAWRCSWL